jgi:hypothetical protein
MIDIINAVTKILFSGEQTAFAATMFRLQKNVCQIKSQIFLQNINRHKKMGVWRTNCNHKNVGFVYKTNCHNKMVFVFRRVNDGLKDRCFQQNTRHHKMGVGFRTNTATNVGCCLKKKLPRKRINFIACRSQKFVVWTKLFSGSEYQAPPLCRCALRPAFQMEV